MNCLLWEMLSYLTNHFSLPEIPFDKSYVQISLQVAKHLRCLM
jgi:hypothetical protein